jgi:hypothetical protein
MSIDTSGNVEVDSSSSQTKAFPSIEGYAYTMVQGELVIVVLFAVEETTPSALNGEQNVPLTTPAQ